MYDIFDDDSYWKYNIFIGNVILVLRFKKKKLVVDSIISGNKINTFNK